MTRTARAAFPRAILKDRSESKSGHRDDKHVRKDGAGAHGWGAIADEKDLEDAAMIDEQLELEHYARDSGGESYIVSCDFSNICEDLMDGKLDALERASSSSSTSGEDLESAKEFRKNALKGKGTTPADRMTNLNRRILVGLDLAAIARTSSAVSTSPTTPSSMRRASVSNGTGVSYPCYLKLSVA